MASIQQIQALIRKSAEESRKQYAENGNTALQPKVNEPIIPLPNNTPNPVINTAPAATSPTVQQTQAIPAEALQEDKIQSLRIYMRQTFRKDLDYCILPNKAVVLQKPGIIKVLRYLNLRAQIQVISSTFEPEKQAVSYVIKASLIDSNCQVVCESAGAGCSSENRFIKAGGINCNNTILQIAMLRAVRSAVKMIIS